MADPKWDRLAASAGAVAAAILAVQAFLVTPPPAFRDPPPGVVDYYARHGSGIQAQLFLTGIAGVFFLWFLGSLRSYLREAEGGTGRLSAVAFGAGIAASGPVAAGALATAALAHLSSGFELRSLAEYGPLTDQVGMAGAAPTLHAIRLLSYTMSWFALGPLLAATAVVVMRTAVLPRWHANFGYALFALSLLAGLGLFVDDGALAPGGAIAYVAFGLFLVWLALTSIVMMQRMGAEEEAPPG